MIRKDFDKEFLEWLQQLDVDEAGPVWSAIENELDLTETWSGIDMELNRVLPQRKKIIPLQFLKIVGVAAIILMISIPLLFVLKKEKISRTPVKQVVSEVTSPGSVSDNSAVPAQAEAAGRSIPQKIPDDPGLVPSGTGNALAHNEIQKAYPTDFIDVGITPPPEITRLGTSGKTMAGDPVPERVEPPISRIVDMRTETGWLLANGYDNTSGLIVSMIETTATPETSPVSFFRILDAGLVYSYKNSWLLNYETWNCLNPAKPGNIMPTFRHDIGITSAVAFKEKHHFGLEFFWISGAGQNYQQYIDASFVDRKIALNYFKLQAFYLWNHRKIPGSTIFGGYYARLGMAEEIQGGQKFRVTDDYRDHDYGLVLGHQLNIPLVNSIVITPGIRINYNLMNIFEGHPGAVNIFKSTNNFSAGLNLAVSYSLKK